MDDQTPTDAQTESTEENTDGSAPDTRAILTALRDEDYPQPATESPSLSTADKVYAGVSGFVIGVVIALALLAAGYVLYQLMFNGPEGSAHDLIDTE